MYETATITKCDVCSGNLGSVMYDAPIQSLGQWANLCHRCHKAHARSGIGQVYKRDGATWTKTRDIKPVSGRRECPKCHGAKLASAPTCGPCAMRALGFGG
jgi:hypothetical protein